MRYNRLRSLVPNEARTSQQIGVIDFFSLGNGTKRDPIILYAGNGHVPQLYLIVMDGIGMCYIYLIGTGVFFALRAGRTVPFSARILDSTMFPLHPIPVRGA